MLVSKSGATMFGSSAHAGIRDCQMAAKTLQNFGDQVKDFGAAVANEARQAASLAS
jgi:hypothetical protein